MHLASWKRITIIVDAMMLFFFKLDYILIKQNITKVNYYNVTVSETYICVKNPTNISLFHYETKNSNRWGQTSSLHVVGRQTYDALKY